MDLSRTAPKIIRGEIPAAMRVPISDLGLSAGASGVAGLSRLVAKQRNDFASPCRPMATRFRHHRNRQPWDHRDPRGCL
jgi:hypothetical protein